MKKARIYYTLATIFFLGFCGVCFYDYKNHVSGTKALLIFSLLFSFTLIMGILFSYAASSCAKESNTKTSKEKIDRLIMVILHKLFALFIIALVFCLAMAGLGLLYPTYLPSKLASFTDWNFLLDLLIRFSYAATALLIAHLLTTVFVDINPKEK